MTIPLPEPNPALHQLEPYYVDPFTTTIEPVSQSDDYSIGGIVSGINEFVSGIGQVGQNVLGQLTGIEQAYQSYEAQQQAPTTATILAAQAQRTQTYLLIGGAILLAVVLLK